MVAAAVGFGDTAAGRVRVFPSRMSSCWSGARLVLFHGRRRPAGLSCAWTSSPIAQRRSSVRWQRALSPLPFTARQGSASSRRARRSSGSEARPRRLCRGSGDAQSRSGLLRHSASRARRLSGWTWRAGSSRRFGAVESPAVEQRRGDYGRRSSLLPACATESFSPAAAGELPALAGDQRAWTRRPRTAGGASRGSGLLGGRIVFRAGGWPRTPVRPGGGRSRQASVSFVATVIVLPPRSRDASCSRGGTCRVAADARAAWRLGRACSGSRWRHGRSLPITFRRRRLNCPACRQWRRSRSCSRRCWRPLPGARATRPEGAAGAGFRSRLMDGSRDPVVGRDFCWWASSPARR